jgi:pantetheine-phosphate adenylyltransferase
MSRAVYAGSFDPFTLGHLNILERASKLFEVVIVVVAVNPDKPQALFTPHERVMMIVEQIHKLKLMNVIVTTTEQAVGEVAIVHDATVFLRAIRDAGDTDHEARLAKLNKQYFPKMETMLLLADPDFRHISSTRARESWPFVGVGFLPPEIELLMAKKLGGAPWRTP